MDAQVQLEDFPARSYDKLRYGDTDRQGHINNAVFSTLLETGRVEMIYDGKSSLNDPGCSFVIVHLSLDYVRELHWPGKIDIGTRVCSIGRSSIRMEQAVFQNGALCAKGETVMVQTNNETRKSQELSVRLQDRLREFVAHAT